MPNCVLIYKIRNHETITCSNFTNNYLMLLSLYFIKAEQHSLPILRVNIVCGEDRSRISSQVPNCVNAIPMWPQ